MVISGLLLVIGVLAGLNIGLVLMLVRQRRGYEAEAARLYIFSGEAMTRLQARNATEYVQVKTAEKTTDLQLKMYEDALERERDAAKKLEKEMDPEPKLVHGFDKDGKSVEINMHDGWEIVE